MCGWVLVAFLAIVSTTDNLTFQHNNCAYGNFARSSGFFGFDKGFLHPTFIVSKLYVVLFFNVRFPHGGEL